MELKSEADIVTLIEEDDWMMEILNIVSQLNLPDCWVCAGFVRSKIWDALYEHDLRTPLADVDVIYYDKTNRCENVEKKIEGRLHNLLVDVPWSVKNEARMHLVNKIEPYISAADAVAKFPETATALAVKLNKNNKVVLLAPHGIEDVVNGRIKPTPYFNKSEDRRMIFEKRLREKRWALNWSQLTLS